MKRFLTCTGLLLLAIIPALSQIRLCPNIKIREKSGRPCLYCRVYDARMLDKEMLRVDKSLYALDSAVIFINTNKIFETLDTGSDNEAFSVTPFRSRHIHISVKRAGYHDFESDWAMRDNLQILEIFLTRKQE